MSLGFEELPDVPGRVTFGMSLIVLILFFLKIYFITSFMLEKKRLYYIDGLKGICCICICILHFLLMFIPKGYIGWGCSAEAAENPFNFYFADFPFSILTNGSFALYVFMALISFIPAYSFF